MTAVLVCGGSLSAAFLKKTAAAMQDVVWYAVDGGLAVMDEAGIKPDYLVGDFDTADPELVARYADLCVTLTHPAEKNATDTELALDYAMEQGALFLLMLGAVGTRLDHTLANFHMLLRAMENGCKAVILNEHNRVTLHRSSFCVASSQLCGKYISFLPFAGEVGDLSLVGTKYPLLHVNLRAGNSLCISNEAAGEQIKVIFHGGYLLMIESAD